MPGGLVALLDDVAALSRLAVSSLDDIAAVSASSGSKAVGVVIDDAAVVPGYVVGMLPERELPVLRKIAIGSLRNKLLFVLPLALLLSAFAPWALTPILMLGGLYLSYEGTEKILRLLKGDSASNGQMRIVDSTELERRQVSGAITTDLILSAEIMAITLNDISGSDLWKQAMVLVIVGVVITILVYGLVAFIIKVDDLGLQLSRFGNKMASVGRGLVRFVPYLLQALSLVGVVAMLWVSGGILIHGSAQLGFALPEKKISLAATAINSSRIAVWTFTALCSGVAGLVAGFVVVVGSKLVFRFKNSLKLQKPLI